MKKIIWLFAFVLCGVTAAYSQGADADWEAVVSDEFHFIAYFPNEPTKTEGKIDTRFGKGYSRRWTLKLPDIFYEVSVDDYPDLTVEMNYKPLNLFYDTVCNDFAGQYGVKCDNYNTTVMFGEYGKNAGGRGKDVFVTVEMYLARQRLYQLKIVMPTAFEHDRQKLEDIRKFLDDFVLVHKKENESKYTYGLPESLSQNYKSQ